MRRTRLCYLRSRQKRRCSVNLLVELGIEVIESKIKPEELLEADEIFCSGNYVKLRKIVKYENKNFKNTPIFDLAYKAYWDWMKTI